MAVVRWLCDQPRPHLKTTRFFVHSHNLNAACLMVLHLESVGYHVQVRPFGVALPRPARSGRLRSLVERAIRWLRTGGNHGMSPMADGDQAGSSEGLEVGTAGVNAGQENSGPAPSGPGRVPWGFLLDDTGIRGDPCRDRSFTVQLRLYAGRRTGSRTCGGTSFGLVDFPGGPLQLSQCPRASAPGRRCSTGLGREYTLGRGAVNLSGFACGKFPIQCHQSETGRMTVCTKGASARRAGRRGGEARRTCGR